MITVKDVLDIFPGATVIEIRGACGYCSGDHIPKWRRGGKIVERTWSDGRRECACHYCGRAVAEQDRIDAGSEVEIDARGKN